MKEIKERKKKKREKKEYIGRHVANDNFGEFEDSKEGLLRGWGLSGEGLVDVTSHWPTYNFPYLGIVWLEHLPIIKNNPLFFFFFLFLFFFSLN